MDFPCQLEKLVWRIVPLSVNNVPTPQYAMFAKKATQLILKESVYHVFLIAVNVLDNNKGFAFLVVKDFT